MGLRGRPVTLGAVVRRGLTDVVGLLLPRECPGCLTWDEALCASCERLLSARPVRCESAAPSLSRLVTRGEPAAAGDRPEACLPVWAVAPYDGPVRGIVLAWKGPGGRGIDAAVAAAGRAAGRAWRGELVAAGVPLGGATAVVPAPSGRARRARGRMVVGSLAAQVAAGLGSLGVPVESYRAVDLLRRARGPRHLSGLGVAGRRATRRGSVRVVAELPVPTRCLLVDDVLTSGATLSECRRALLAAGHEVLAALVLAATPPPGGSGGVGAVAASGQGLRSGYGSAP